jgi:hypothetical protein
MQPAALVSHVRIITAHQRSAVAQVKAIVISSDDGAHCAPRARQVPRTVLECRVPAAPPLGRSHRYLHTSPWVSRKWVTHTQRHPTARHTTPQRGPGSQDGKISVRVV